MELKLVELTHKNQILQTYEIYKHCMFMPTEEKFNTKADKFFNDNFITITKLLCLFQVYLFYCFIDSLKFNVDRRLLHFYFPEYQYSATHVPCFCFSLTARDPKKLSIPTVYHIIILSLAFKVCLVFSRWSQTALPGVTKNSPLSCKIPWPLFFFFHFASSCLH